MATAISATAHQNVGRVYQASETGLEAMVLPTMAVLGRAPRKTLTDNLRTKQVLPEALELGRRFDKAKKHPHEIRPAGRAAASPPPGGYVRARASQAAPGWRRWRR